MYVIGKLKWKTAMKKSHYFLGSGIYGWHYHNRSGHISGNSVGVHTAGTPKTACGQRLKACQDFLAADYTEKQTIWPLQLCVRVFNFIENET